MAKIGRNPLPPAPPGKTFGPRTASVSRRPTRNHPEQPKSCGKSPETAAAPSPLLAAPQPGPAEPGAAGPAGSLRCDSPEAHARHRGVGTGHTGARTSGPVFFTQPTRDPQPSLRARPAVPGSRRRPRLLSSGHGRRRPSRPQHRPPPSWHIRLGVPPPPTCHGAARDDVTAARAAGAAAVRRLYGEKRGRHGPRVRVPVGGCKVAGSNPVRGACPGVPLVRCRCSAR